MPARKPTELKRQQGTLQPCRTNFDEPKPRLGIPETPDHLPERSKAVYPRVAKMLFEMGVLAPYHGMALAGLCQAYCDWAEAVEFLEERGSTVYTVTRVSPDGTAFEDFKPYPQVAMRNDADKRMRAWMQSFGMTPADQAKISVLDKKEEDPWDGLMEQ
jgi:P27 family predicted phage terminase small subunit